MALKDSTINKVRSVPLTEVLSCEGIEFKKVGREAVTLCPWHNDSHPSLTINDDKNLCFCFACGGGSDGIAFVQQKFGLGFADAVIRIAEKHNIAIEHDDLDPEQALRVAQQRKRALAQVESEQQIFRSALKEASGLKAREWLLRRGITPQICREFELGYARGGYFRDRITVPVHDHRGMLVGFTGRRINDEIQPKYKNSASSEIFDKGALLFNEHRASAAARQSGYLVFVEGHFDVITLWQHGIHNVVATQGTAAPSIHSIKRLVRQCRRFVLLYDADDGGTNAIEHFIKAAGRLACDGELTLGVASLPQGMDPEDCIKAGVDLHALIEGAPQWLDWIIDKWLKDLDRSDTFRFSQAEQAIRELVQSIKSPALRQHYIDKSAKVLGSNAKSAAKLAQSWYQSLGKTRTAVQWHRPGFDWVRNQAERRFLRSYIHFPETRAELTSLGTRLQSPSHLWLWNRLVELEQHCPEWQADAVMAILAVAEPNYVRILRPLVMPTIKMDNQKGILGHVQAVLTDGEE